MSSMHSAKTDIILSMSHTPTEDYMQQIVQRVKTHEFRKKFYPTSVVRIWFYETAPVSAITYICEIHVGHVRGTGDLPTGGIGNVEYNNHHPDWGAYDYAYKIIGCWRLMNPIGLEQIKEKYGIGGAPRGMVYAPEQMRNDVVWYEQDLIWREGYCSSQ